MFAHVHLRTRERLWREATCWACGALSHTARIANPDNVGPPIDQIFCVLTRAGGVHQTQNVTWNVMPPGTLLSPQPPLQGATETGGREIDDDDLADAWPLLWGGFTHVGARPQNMQPKQDRTRARSQQPAARNSIGVTATRRALTWAARR